MTTTTKPTRSPKEAASMSKTEDVAKRLADARFVLNRTLMTGHGDSASLRSLVRDLEAEQARLATVAAATRAAEQARKEAVDEQREASIRAASQTLLEARNARLAAVRAAFC